MAAGEYSERVVRWVRTRTNDGYGDKGETYAEGVSYWAAADAQTASDETVLRDKRNTERITFRLRQRVAVAAGDRLFWVNTGQYWQVESRSATDAETTCQCWLVDGVKR